MLVCADAERIPSVDPQAMSDDRRQFGPRQVAGALARVTRPLLRRQGLAAASIVPRWTEIVGGTLAAHTLPVRYTPDRSGGGTLRIRVDGGWAPEIQHLEPVVIERINAFFGYRAVSRLALVQGPLPGRGSAPAAAPVAAEPPAEELAAIEEIADERLREAFRRLARARAARPDSVKKS